MCDENERMEGCKLERVTCKVINNNIKVMLVILQNFTIFYRFYHPHDEVYLIKNL